MGREIKRVALDFDWPLETIWPGYLEEEESDPPEGPGYQLWETTTEGSPVSPVFAEPIDLAKWMTENPCMFATAASPRQP